MTPWQALCTALTDPAQQPHPLMGQPQRLAAALLAALEEEPLCPCARCPAEAWQAVSVVECAACEAGTHGDQGAVAWGG